MKYQNVSTRADTISPLILCRMLTRWGRELDREHPLPEHPRPQLVRDTEWVNLNGPWDYAFTSSEHRPADDAAWHGRIVVPFSPEAELSGVGRQLQPDEWLWYRRTDVVAPTPPEGGRVLLHFGAVDQSCTVWVDGVEVGSHTGGYLPFSFDITEPVTELVDRAGPTGSTATSGAERVGATACATRMGSASRPISTG